MPAINVSPWRKTLRIAWEFTSQRAEPQHGDWSVFVLEQPINCWKQIFLNWPKRWTKVTVRPRAKYLSDTKRVRKLTNFQGKNLFRVQVCENRSSERAVNPDPIGFDLDGSLKGSQVLRVGWQSPTTQWRPQIQEISVFRLIPNALIHLHPLMPTFQVLPFTTSRTQDSLCKK